MKRLQTLPLLLIVAALFVFSASTLSATTLEGTCDVADTLVTTSEVTAPAPQSASMTTTTQTAEMFHPLFTPAFLDTSLNFCALDQECVYGCEIWCGGVGNPCFTACIFPGCCIL